MTGQQEQEQTTGGTTRVTWGPKLFYGTLVAVLGFFYWLLIYSGGVTGHAG